MRESFNVQFRAEFFDILNHANFRPPLAFIDSTSFRQLRGGGNAALFNQDGPSSGGGGLSNLTTQPRDIQFALKVIF